MLCKHRIVLITSCLISLVAIALVPFGTALALSESDGITESITEERPINPLQQCQDILKDCFVKAGYQKNQCFFSRGQHPFCEGTVLGKLALKRWTYSQSDSNSPQFHALTGPRFVDQECVKRFEVQWSTALLSNESNEQTFERLFATLEKCERMTQQGVSSQ